MIEAEDLQERVLAFVSEAANVSVERLSLGTRLEEDLGITGEDAVELLSAFAERFGVDTARLDFHKHFGPEGCNPLWLLYKPPWLKSHGAYPVTIHHLIRVAEARRWFSPPYA